MKEQFSRTAAVLGKPAIEKLNNSSVAVFGIGGVGGFAVEALARAGVGKITLIDNKKVSKSNINRQIIALNSTIGQYKTEVAKKRIADINPDCRVEIYNLFFLPENAQKIDFREFDYVIDAVDTVTAKLEIVQQCNKLNIPVISAMGAGNKTDPTAFKVADISKTKVCPLARAMRQNLKKLGIFKLKTVYSEELPTVSSNMENTPGSLPFVPSVMGLIIAGEVIKNLCR